MNQRLELLLNLINWKRRDKLYYAGKKFKVWQRFFDDILSKNKSDANIFSLVFTMKMIIFCSIIEYLIDDPNLGSKNKFKNVLKSLSTEEKLIFNNNILISDEEAEENLDKTSIGLYLNNNDSDLEKIFEDKLDYFYGIRSAFVHKASRPGNAYFNGEVLFYLVFASKSKNQKEITIKILERAFRDFGFPICLDEIILRAILRYFSINIEPDDTKEEIKKVFINSGIATKNYQLFKQKFES